MTEYFFQNEVSLCPMTYEKSCGAVVFTRIDGEIKYVLAQALGGHFGFPKGHMEPDETEKETALREIYEEVHLHPSLIAGFREISEYNIPSLDVHKQVVFFLGEFYDQTVCIQSEELRSAPLVSYKEAMQLLTHEDSRKILTKAHAFLNSRKYYKAYDDRYRQIHEQNLQWFCENPSAIVMETIQKYKIAPSIRLLELGCGEGRDAIKLLHAGYNLLATDVSPAAITFCRKKWPEFASHFAVLDCVAGETEERFDFIYAVAVVHMLVTDEDRAAFYSFIRTHLNPGGFALICTMGDGKTERKTDIRTAFDIQDRVHQQTGKPVRIAGTSCRMVSFETLREELKRNDLAVAEEGMTSVEPDFPVMMYTVVKGEKYDT